MSETAPLWVTAVSGSIAGFSQDILLHPMDTIRARLQCKTTGPQRPITAFLEVARETMSGPSGARGLYRGFSSVLFFCLPTNALYFGGYSFWRQRLLKVYNRGVAADLNIGERAFIDLGAGFGAELTSVAMWTPYDVLKQRLQVHDEDRHGAGHITADNKRLINTCRQIYRTEGVAGFYRGLLTGIAVWGPYSAIFFASYEALKISKNHSDGSSSGSTRGSQKLHPDSARHNNIVELSELACGVLAGACAAIATQPLDCVKTRFQTASLSSSLPRLTVLSVFIKLVNTEGTGALFRGTMGRVLWLAPGSGLTIFVFETACAAITGR